MLGRTMSQRELPCPCGGPSYEACCARFHRGEEPETAEALMRSRYSAFVKRDVAYLQRTLHPSHEDHALTREAFAQRMKNHFAAGYAYVGLRILATTPPDERGVSTVTFRASVKKRGKDVSFTERSSFASDGVGLRYVGGEMIA